MGEGKSVGERNEWGECRGLNQSDGHHGPDGKGERWVELTLRQSRGFHGP
jgi:hypothetical protein